MPARLILPAFLLSSPTLSFSPFSHFTHLQPKGLRTEMESQAQQHRSQTPIIQNFNIPKQRGAYCRHQPTCLPNSICMESTTKERVPVAEGLPEKTNAIGDSRKTTETETRSSLATVYACTVSWWSIRGIIWTPTNQIRALSARAHLSRELRARARLASRGI